MALPINILTGLSSSSNSNTNWNFPAFQTTTILDTTFPNNLRNVILTPDGVRVAYGTNTEGIALSDLLVLFATNNNTVTFAPYVSSDPSNMNVAAPAAASFSIAVTSELSKLIQWQLSTNGGVSFANQANGGVYSNMVNATTMNISNSAGLNGNQYRALIINNIGSTTSNAAILTVT